MTQPGESSAPQVVEATTPGMLSRCRAHMWPPCRQPCLIHGIGPSQQGFQRWVQIGVLPHEHGDLMVICGVILWFCVARLSSSSSHCSPQVCQQFEAPRPRPNSSPGHGSSAWFWRKGAQRKNVMRVNGTYQTSVREYHCVLALQLPSQNRFRCQIFRISRPYGQNLRFFTGFWHWFKLRTHAYQAWQMLRLLRLLWHAKHCVCTMSNSAPLHGQLGNGIYLWLPWSMNLPKKIYDVKLPKSHSFFLGT